MTPTYRVEKRVDNRYIFGMDKKKEYPEGLDENGRFAQGNQLHKKRENVGRPSKLPRFLEAFACVVDVSHPVGRAIIHTDKDLLRMTNRELSEKDRISMTAFESYKRGDLDDDGGEMSLLLDEFYDIYMEALESQRENLFQRMMEKGEARSWGRWSWIIERKFDDWNLRKKQVDETPDRKQLVFRVIDGDDEGDD